MLVILIALAIRGGGGMLQNKLNSKEDQHIPFSDGTDIIINAKEAAVTLLTDTDEEDLVVTYKGGDKAAFSHNDKQVSITVGKHSVWGGRNGSLYVSIPSKRTIGSLTIKTESGAIELPALSLQGDFEASSTSGRINLANITAGGHIRLSTTSGTINAANLADGEKAEIESVSGRISLDSYQGKDMTDPDHLPAEVSVWFSNANDHSIEGLIEPQKKVASVQFHPEASPGPHENWKKCCASLGAIRSRLGKELFLIPPHTYEFCWIIDFPLFEYNDEEGHWEAAHHMFSMRVVRRWRDSPCRVSDR